MWRISNCFVVLATVALAFALPSSGSSQEPSPTRAPEQILGSDLHFCASKSASIASCKERLQTALTSYSDKHHAPLNRHAESLAGILSDVLSRQPLRVESELRLSSAILEILKGADSPASAISKSLTNAKQALAASNIRDADRSSVIGSLTVLSQDVRGPEDEGAQIAPSLPNRKD
jgi:hypothetical protein